MVAIVHQGRSVEFGMYSGTIYPDFIQYVRDNVYPKIDIADVRKQLYDVVVRGKTNSHNLINGHWFAKLQGDVRLDRAFYSPNDFLLSDEWVSAMKEYIEAKPKTFTPSNPLMVNVHKFLKISLFRIVGGATNFPLTECVRLLAKYRRPSTNTYIDTSCGWGVRMLAAAVLDLDYIGFEVNPPLISNLNELGQEIQRFKPDWKFEVIPHGSEYYEPRLEGKAEIMLTSPPYFILEDYKNGEQSCRPDTDFDTWCESFLYPTLDNSFQYAAPDTCVIINIKNYKEFDMEDRCIKYAESKSYQTTLDTLAISQRVIAGEIRSSNERVFVFHKHPLNPKTALDDLF